ncbi:hypothetical protein AVEN_180244-1 [Araneus ventricosus]|uniref:Uncharacterized protein n=1 Tax=Araneus ventricosus TaxID=182803 RepID=A0A4Y2JBV6_ARAVE|nr:hypothetical protein AVEN_180244-1 [Araneus ventricosus]
MTRTTPGIAHPLLTATPAGGCLMYDLACNRPNKRRIFSGIGFRTWKLSGFSEGTLPLGHLGLYVCWHVFIQEQEREVDTDNVQLDAGWRGQLLDSIRIVKTTIIIINNNPPGGNLPDKVYGYTKPSQRKDEIQKKRGKN